MVVSSATASRKVARARSAEVKSVPRRSVALVGSYELFMTIIRGARQPDDRVPGTAHVHVAVSGTDPLRVRAAEVFAADVTARRVPSIRAIRARLRVGQPRAQQVRAYLATLADG
jgi:hypothetical protein